MAKNMLTEAQNNFWYASGASRSAAMIGNIQEQLLIHEIANQAFMAGARWSSKMSSQLSPHIARFIEMMILLGWFDETLNPPTENVHDAAPSTRSGSGATLGRKGIGH